MCVDKTASDQLFITFYHRQFFFFPVTVSLKVRLEIQGSTDAVTAHVCLCDTDAGGESSKSNFDVLPEFGGGSAHSVFYTPFKVEVDKLCKRLPDAFNINVPSSYPTAPRAGSWTLLHCEAVCLCHLFMRRATIKSTLRIRKAETLQSFKIFILEIVCFVCFFNTSPPCIQKLLTPLKVNYKS